MLKRFCTRNYFLRWWLISVKLYTWLYDYVTIKSLNVACRCASSWRSLRNFYWRSGYSCKEDLVRENLVLVLEEDYIDLEESAIDNILLTIPMQVLSEEEQNSDTMPSGNSWSVLTEEQYNALQNKKKKENSPFSALNGLFEDW